ncbi:ATP-dependent Clp protease protease subunit [Herbihabitans rhizosphaerae]|uniref:ATP-dependent Clp protease proteolytic subunit n=1 Tax=Herbihabitans rhizosphaerae TaxID=1872711 RepID=A0A4Q7KEG4_9PSEU|nr:ATP-dependent Clp protease proteolytic subunit [Herbihabitans rhizosphaerae]RZS32273.1 ATP-dependent Clp protease protease subunit [Herbihabitans rhizosphaerae]
MNIGSDARFSRYVRSVEPNPFEKLYEERIIFLGTQIDDASAGDVIAQLIHLEGANSDRDIEIYLNSPGGSLTAMLAIYDTMRFVRPRIRTVCVGQVGSAAALILAAGSPGMRACLPNARVLIRQPAAEGLHGQASDLHSYATELQRMRQVMETMLAHHTGKSAEEIHSDIERQKVLTAEEAREYRIVDEVLPYRKAPA